MATKRCPYCMDGTYASPLTNWDGVRCDRCDGSGWVETHDHASRPERAEAAKRQPLNIAGPVAAMRAEIAARKAV